MAAQLHFNLVSPERQLASRDVHMVVVPGEDGDFGVLAGHAPFMSTIRPGVIAIYQDAGGAAERIFIDGGFADVGEGGLTILAENAVPVGEINAAALGDELGKAQDALRLATGDIERHQAERRIARLEAMRAAAAQ